AMVTLNLIQRDDMNWVEGKQKYFFLFCAIIASIGLMLVWFRFYGQGSISFYLILTAILAAANWYISRISIKSHIIAWATIILMIGSIVVIIVTSLDTNDSILNNFLLNLSTGILGATIVYYFLKYRWTFGVLIILSLLLAVVLQEIPIAQ